MTVREIIIIHLSEIGADGLRCDESIRDNCFCTLDDGIMRCNEPDKDYCVPAKRTIATEPGEYHEIGDTIYEEMK